MIWLVLFYWVSHGLMNRFVIMLGIDPNSAELVRILLDCVKQKELTLPTTTPVANSESADKDSGNRDGGGNTRDKTGSGDAQGGSCAEDSSGNDGTDERSISTRLRKKAKK
jgi:hypothetical protein